MLIKLFGSSVIIIACGLIGIIIANNYRLRPWQLKTLKGSLQMLETEMVYASTPLPEALKKISKQIDEPISSLYRVAAEKLNTGELPVPVAWQLGVEALKETSVLTARDYSLIESFGNYLGSTDKEEQIKHIRLMQEQLGQQENVAENEREKGEKLWKYCGFLVGIVIILLIY
ncbi:stage III sporulation protein AB [Desulfitispora alkaliphila]|uniref:stage III sporulation protein SpoIIIAB n=1 Tax=Desulfitispora alkaliphila TaxID=622674 RepID=UPI003D1E16A1